MSAKSETNDLDLIDLMNGIESNKFRLFASRILEKLHTKETPFTSEEESKLTTVLAVEHLSTVKAIIARLESLFKNIVYNLMKPKSLSVELLELGFNEEKVAIISQLWIANGSKVVERLKEDAFNSSPRQLSNVNWKIGVNLNNHAISEVNAIETQLNLILSKNGNEADLENVSLQFDHSELSAFYSQLECIQNKIDALLK